MFDVYRSMVRFTPSNDVFARLHVLDSEIMQLLTIVRMLGAGSMENYIVTFPAFLSSHLSFDLFSAAKVRSYDDLLSLVEHSDYYDILGRFRPISSDTRADITGIETALLTYYYRTALELVRRNYHGETTLDLEEILFTRLDLHNLLVIYRLKRFFGSSPEEIEGRLIPVRGHISPHTLRSLAEASDASAVLVQLKNVQMLRRFLQDPGQSIEHVIGTYTRSRCERLFRFSIKPAVVLMSYMLLLGFEINNIVHIIEGIRYNTPPEEIRRLLV
jgi:V/A-type H+-transporting ATPase subunit C